MSGSEPRLMFGRGAGESYGMTLHNPSSSPSGGGASMSNMCLAYSTDETAVYKPIMPNSPSYHQNMIRCTAQESGGGVGSPPPQQVQALELHPGADVIYMNNNNHNSNKNINNNNSIIGGGVVEPVKRKRGRPRKYALDGGVPATPPSGGSGFSGDVAAEENPSRAKRGRGRPPGSGRKQQSGAVHGSAEHGFTTHLVTVNAGEDITSRVLSYSQNGARAVCILSAMGAISNITLCQSETPSESVAYEGQFHIVTLSGLFIPSESGGEQGGRASSLRVSLSRPDGTMLGGCVVGLLIAASPVQMLVASFIEEDGLKESNTDNQYEPSFPAPPQKPAGGAGSSPSGELSGGPGSSINHQGIGNMSSFSWT